MVLLIAITLVVFAVSQAVITEKKVSANQLRSYKAFEAAETGLAAGLESFRTGSIASGAGTVATGALERYEYSFTTIAGSSGKYELTSIGYSDDESARRTMTTVVKTPPGLGTLPKTPVVAKSTVNLSGNFSITNEEGASTVWTGSSFEIQSNAAATYVSHPSIEGAVIQSSTSTYRGPDIIDSDPNLATLSEDDFARAFLGETTDEYCDSVGWKDYDSFSALETAEPEALEKSLVCIRPADGTFDWQADPQKSYGLIDKGIAIVIDADVDMNGQFTGETDPDGSLYNGCGGNLCGLLFIDGKMEFTGGPTINGSVVVTSNFAKAGTADINFSAGALESIGGNNAEATAIPGTWKDW